MRKARLATLALSGALVAGACSLGLEESDIRETGTTTSASSTGSGGAGGAGVTTGTATTGTAGAGGGAECWAADPSDAASWAVSSIAIANLTGDNARSLEISPDGLTLTWVAAPVVAGSAMHLRPHATTRTNRSAPFAGGMVLADWPTLLLDADSPALSQGGDEMLLNTGPDLSVAVRAPGMGLYAEPVAVPSLSSNSTETLASSTEDGSRVIFQRNDGPMGEWRLYEATRVAPTPGGAFDAPVLVSIPLLGATDFVVCPVLSPDGLRLFFSSNYPVPVGDPNANPASNTNVHVTERESLAAPWGLPKPIAAFDSDTAQTCVSSVTADGCEVYLNHFATVGGGTTTTELVATR